MCECNSTVVSGVDRRVGVVSIVNCSMPVNHIEPSSAFRATFSDERSESTPPSAAASSQSDTSCTANNTVRMPAISQNRFHENSARTLLNSAGHMSPAMDYSSEQSDSDATELGYLAMQSTFPSTVMSSTSALNDARLLTRTNGTDVRYQSSTADGVTDNFCPTTSTRLLSSLSAANNQVSSTEPGDVSSAASFVVLENTAAVTELHCPAEETLILEAQREPNMHSFVVEPADDDGYMDELDVAIAAAAGDTRHQLCDDLDAGLDDFIDADMPHNVRSSPVGESPSSGSLSSLRDEQIQEQELAIGGNVVNMNPDRANETATVKPSTDINMAATQQNYQFGESFLVSNSRPNKLSWPKPNGEVNQNCGVNGAEACANVSSRVQNMSSSSATQFSNPTSECSFDTPPASLPSPNYDLFAGVVDGVAAVGAAPQLAMLSDDNAFDDDDFRLSADSNLPNGTESLSDNASCVPPRRNECFWLPISDVHPIVNSPSFGCWSCFSAMDGIDPCRTCWKSNCRVVQRPDTSCVQADVKVPDYIELVSRETTLNGMRKQNSMDSDARTRGCSEAYPYRRQVQSSASINEFSSQMSSSLTLDDRRFDDEDQPYETTALSSPATRNSRFSSSLRLRVNSHSSDTNGRAHWSSRIESTAEPSAIHFCDISHFGLDASKSSSCSTVAVMHILHMLGIEHNHREVGEMMHANRTVSDKTDLCDFLKAHSRAGLSGEQLINGLTKVTGGRIYGKFFGFPRKFELVHWLASWMRIGAVPLATLKFSIKSSAESSVEVDTWMHMTIHSVLSSGIVMGDQLSFVTESELTAQLVADSTVRLPRNDIVSRWRDDCDLSVIAMHPDPRWRDLNVLGQVVNILRESRLPSSYGCRPYLTSHLTLPTHCRSGITLYAAVDSPAFVCLQRESADHMPSTVSNSLPSDCMTPTDGCVRTSAAAMRSFDDLSPSASAHKRSSAV